MNRGKIVANAILTAALVLAGASAASAKPFCLQDNNGKQYIFTKVKLPKKPGETTTFVGTTYLIGGAFPINVTTTMLTDGAIQAVAIVQTPFPIGLTNMTEWLTDKTLTGTVYFDNDGDFTKDDGSYVLSSLDCSLVMIP